MLQVNNSLIDVEQTGEFWVPSWSFGRRYEGLYYGAYGNGNISLDEHFRWLSHNLLSGRVHYDTII
jgi:hypothetical protein